MADVLLFHPGNRVSLKDGDELSMVHGTNKDELAYVFHDRGGSYYLQKKEPSLVSGSSPSSAPPPSSHYDSVSSGSNAAEAVILWFQSKEANSSQQPLNGTSAGEQVVELSPGPENNTLLKVIQFLRDEVIAETIPITGIYDGFDVGGWSKTDTKHLSSPSMFAFFVSLVLESLLLSTTSIAGVRKICSKEVSTETNVW